MRRDVFDFACTGDSLTGGHYSREWQVDVAERLSLLSSRPVRNYNFGLNGTSTPWGLQRMPEIVALRPRAVVIAFGMNDCTAEGVTVSQYMENLRQMIVIVRQGSPQSAIFLMTMNPLATDLNVSGVTMRLTLPQYYEALRRTASEQRVGLIDNDRTWVGATSAEIPDGVHPLKSALLLNTIPNVVNALNRLL